MSAVARTTQATTRTPVFNIIEEHKEAHTLGLFFQGLVVGICKKRYSAMNDSLRKMQEKSKVVNDHSDYYRMWERKSKNFFLHYAAISNIETGLNMSITEEIVINKRKETYTFSLFIKNDAFKSKEELKEGCRQLMLILKKLKPHYMLAKKLIPITPYASTEGAFSGVTFNKINVKVEALIYFMKLYRCRKLSTDSISVTFSKTTKKASTA